MDWVEHVRRRVLVVDDQGSVADEAARAAHEAGAECVRCVGERGLRLMEGNCEPDVVLCAWHGDRSSSGHIIERLHGLGYHGPVIAIVDHEDAVAARDARAAGADDIIMGPLTADEVCNALGRWSRSK